MSIPHQHHEDSRHTFNALMEGWNALRQRAAHALTHFIPSGAVDAAPMRGASRWGLLAAEVREMADRVVVAIEAPGMRAGDFEVDVIESALVIRGEKRVADGEDGTAVGRYFLLERAYGRFERVIHLPAEVDRDRAAADYRCGVLTVMLPKRTRQRAGRVAVSGG